jgi:short-subunit dehydrogenase
MEGQVRSRVVVVTGASSGIGRASAERFAALGDQLVLVARGREALDEVARACREAGGQAVVVTSDVSAPGDLSAVVQAALERFGQVDIWVNCAGVGAVGAFEVTPMSAHEQVIATDLVGYMRGAHAVVPQFKAQGRGVLINLLSLGSWAPSPYASSYSAAKFGLRGFTDALRGELSAWRDIHVCDVLPSFVDTPGMQHGGNYVGTQLKPPPGVVDVEAVARAVVQLADHPQRQVVIGRGVTAVARTAHALAPGATMAMMARLLETYFALGQFAPRGSGNLFFASANLGAAGGWRRPVVRTAAAIATGSVLALGVLSLMRRRSSAGTRRR